MTLHDPVSDYARIERALQYLNRDRAAGQAPSLGDVARHVRLSESHFQRMFTRWVGISPKRFLQYRTAEVVKRLLREQRAPLLDTTYAAGLSGPGRLHDLIVNAEAVTPGEYQRAGAGLEVRYGFHPSPFGECLIAMTARGICHLSFIGPVTRGVALRRLRHDWPAAELTEDARGTRAVVARIFPARGARGVAMALHVKGTNFQLKVWRALLDVPDGAVTTYGAIASTIGDPKASRAVGTAVGGNPVSWLIPCHRVVRSTGALGGYAWGPERKRVMLAFEASR